MCTDRVGGDVQYDDVEDARRSCCCTLEVFETKFTDWMLEDRVRTGWGTRRTSIQQKMERLSLLSKTNAPTSSCL